MAAVPDTPGADPAAAPQPAAGDVGRDRRVAARRLVLAALASGLVHLALFGGLSATRIGLFDGRPQDPTAVRPALRPKVAADYPLTVPRSPASKPAHEQPLELAAPPAAVPERPRPAPQKLVERKDAAEQPTEPAASKPDLERIEPSRDVAAKAADPLERRAAAAGGGPAATAERLEAAAAEESARPAPKPAAPRPRVPTASAAAVVDRGDAANESPAVAAGPAVVPTPRPEPAMPVPAPAIGTRPVTRRAPAVTAAPTDTAVDMAGDAAGGLPATSPPEPAAVPRPSRDSARLAARPGPQPAIRRRSTAADADAADADAEVVSPGIRPLASQSAATPGRRVTGPILAAGPPGGDAAAGPAAPAPLARAATATAAAAATTDSTAATAVVADAPAWTAATAAAGKAQGGGSPQGGAAAAGGGASSGGPAPAAAAGSRLAARASGRGGAAKGAARQPGMAAIGGAAAAIAGPSAPGDDAAEEESLSVGGIAAGAARVAAPRRGTAGGVGGAAANGRSAGQGPATTDAAAGGAAGDGTAPIAVRPLGRASGFALPAEGREREVALPFARRARSERDAASRAATSDIAVREKARTAADAMVDRGLEFLVRAQQPDGRWRLDAYPGSDADAPRLVSDTAATGLAILSFLGAGHDHFGGRHRDTVRRGLEFLLAAQKADGDLYVPADELSDSCSWLYSHGIASMALCEAVGMTGDPLVKPAAARACGFIAASQHPTRGGWRYTPRSDADLSVSGWMLVALRSGRLAGVDVDPRALAGVKTLLEQSAVAGDPTRYLYNPRNAQQRPSRLSSACMTAVGTLGRLHTGWSPADPRVRRAADALLAMRPAYGTPTQRSRDCYLWYYASQVLVHTGGDAWADWYDALADTLERTQERSGPAAGSWDPLGDVPDRWGAYGGRIYVTTLHLLTLEVPDRRLPTYGSPEDVRDPPARGSKP